MAELVLRPSVFRRELEHRTVAAGSTLAEALADFQSTGARLAVQLDGEVIPEERWSEVKLTDSCYLEVVAVPAGGGGGGGGGKQVGMIVAAIAIAAASAGTMSWVSSGLTAAGWSATAAGFAGAAAGAAVGMAGGVILNQLTKPPQPGPREQKRTFSITSLQNQPNPYGVIPRVLGKHKFYPPIASPTFTRVEGPDQWVHVHLAWQGPCTISDVKIGGTDISTFDDVTYEVREKSTDSNLTVYPNNLIQEVAVNALLDDSFTTRTISNVTRLQVDLFFAEGVRRTENGGYHALQVKWEIDYREVGAGSWTSWIDPTEASGGFVDNLINHPTWRTHKKIVPLGDYEVRVRRASDNGLYSDGTPMSPLYFQTLRGWTFGDPLPDDTLCEIGIEAKATEELNGFLDRISCVAWSRFVVWDSGTETWGNLQATSNPAACLRGVLVEAGVPYTEIDSPTLGEWYEWCETKGFECNGVVDTEMSLLEVLDKIASSGRASVDHVDGKWSVIFEHTGNVPIVQHVTAHNSWDVSSELTYFDAPHALRCQFYDAESDWAAAETTIYDDGYTSANATEIKDMDFREAFVTSHDQVFKLARYWIAAMKLRPETYAFSMDAEHILCSRGTRVRLQRDEFFLGKGSGRVKSRSGSTITLESPIDLDGGTTYAMRFRYPGTTRSSGAFTFSGSGTVSQVTLSGTPTNAVAGTLYHWGESGSEDIEAVVTGIEPFPDGLGARVTAVPYNTAIYTADNATIPDWDAGIGDNGPGESGKRKPAVPQIKVVRHRRITSSDRPGQKGKFQLTVAIQMPATRRPDPKWFQIDVRKQDDPWRDGDRQLFGAEEFGRFEMRRPVPPGYIYEVRARSMLADGVTASPWSSTYTKNLAGAEATIADYGTITNLQVEGGGTTFTTKHCDIEWELTTPGFTNSTDPAEEDDSFSHFLVTVYDGATPVRTKETKDQEYRYTFAMNRADNGSPIRDIGFRVEIVDIHGNKGSSPPTITASNPPPAALTGMTLEAFFERLDLKFNMPTDPDLAGILVWKESSSGFNPATTDPKRDGLFDSVKLRATGDATYYVRAAAYDHFSKTGLNYGSELTATALQLVGEQIAEGQLTANHLADDAVEARHILESVQQDLQKVEVVSALPTTGNFEGRQVFLLTDDRLYTYTSGAWRAATADATIPDGSITETKIASDAISSPKIQANAVGANKIAAGAVTAVKLAVDSVTAGAIAAGAVIADKIGANAVVSDKIAANAITASKLAVGVSENIVPNPVWLQDEVGAITTDDGLEGFVITDGGPTDDWTVEVSTGTFTDPPTERHLLIRRGTTSTSNIFRFRTYDVEVEPGASYRVNGQVYLNSSGGSEFAQVSVIWLGMVSGTLTQIGSDSGPEYYETKNAWVYFGNDSTTTPNGNVFTAPSGATKARFRWEVRDNDTTDTVNHRLTQLSVRRVAGTTLIEDGAVTTDKVVAGAIEASKIAAGAVTATKISVDAISANKIQTNAIITDKINASAVTTGKIFDDAVTESDRAFTFGSVTVSGMSSTDIQSWTSPNTLPAGTRIKVGFGCVVYGWQDTGGSTDVVLNLELLRGTGVDFTLSGIRAPDLSAQRTVVYWVWEDVLPVATAPTYTLRGYMNSGSHQVLCINRTIDILSMKK